MKTGCQWQILPDNFPKWKTVYHHFRSLSERGWFQK
ncbi:MAG: transposase [Bacteroides sp.]|nr:transposase [Bacteroides sp.]